MAEKSKAQGRDQSVTSPGAGIDFSELIEEASGTVANPTPFYRMLRAMEMDATADVEDGSFTGDDYNVFDSAVTDEDVWEADEIGPLNFQHLAGCDLKIIKIQVKYSRGGSDILTPFIAKIPQRDGTTTVKKMYLFVTATRLSNEQDNKLLNLPAPGEIFQANTSARYLVYKLWTFYQRGAIDPDGGKAIECHVRATDLGDGAAVLKLRPLGRQTVSAEAPF